MMKERPILFSTEMVQAILADRKTQTRRVVKPQPPDDYEYMGTDTDRSSGEDIFYACWEGEKYHNIKCPYGQVGDLIWVRETFCATGSYEYVTPSTGLPFFYKADVIDRETEKEVMNHYGWKYKPSIHMPKSAARIWLRITNVRVQRLHEITPDDCRREGKPNGGYTQDNWAKLWFETLWQSINGFDSWNANPWVWVIEFEVISKTGKP